VISHHLPSSSSVPLAVWHQPPLQTVGPVHEPLRSLLERAQPVEVGARDLGHSRLQPPVEVVPVASEQPEPLVRRLDVGRADAFAQLILQLGDLV
jgi:hypothetical protein